MQIHSTIAGLRAALADARLKAARIAFAPTSIGHHEIATGQPLQASLKLIEKSTHGQPS